MIANQITLKINKTEYYGVFHISNNKTEVRPLIKCSSIAAV